MTQIKSENLKTKAENWTYDNYSNPESWDADKIQSAANKGYIAGYTHCKTEFTESHTKELQELRDKAVAEYKKCCPFIGSTNNCTKGDTDCDWKCPRPHCEFISLFAQKLNEK